MHTTSNYMTKSIDFVYMSGNCPSEGCPEYFFNHKSSFNDEHARNAFLKAMQTIKRYSLLRTYISKASPLKTEEEISDFVNSMHKSVPDCFDVTTIFSCKHGKILYQKSIRFTNVQNTDDLVQKIKTALPSDLEKSKTRPIESYIMNVK